MTSWLYSKIIIICFKLMQKERGIKDAHTEIFKTDLNLGDGYVWILILFYLLGDIRNL